MSDHSGESVSQLVLDNRKLIVGFALLILLCGLFFVIGFMEGKRQGMLRAGEKIPDGHMARRDSGAPPSTTKSTIPQPGSSSVADTDVRDKLDWYGSVNKPADSTVKGLESKKSAIAPPLPARKLESPPATSPLRASTASEPKPKPRSATQPVRVSYSAQVGAFRQRKEAEAKAAVLIAKKYVCVIEPSGEPNQLFLLKVGKYESRADAIAMQNRLKRDGFTAFIKTNK